MKNTPVDYGTVEEKLQQSGITDMGTATIREIKKLVDDIEAATGTRFVRMEMGIPGLPTTRLAVEAEKEAMDRGITAIYPDIYGIPELKKEISRFVKLFLNLDVSPEGCIPTVGSMMGAFAAFLTVNRMWEKKNKTLFIDPGFPVQKQQVTVLGQQYESFDVYNYRGDKLRDKLESYLSKGDIASMIYSNPNNPSWICFTEKELQIIGELADKYNVVVIEDLAYFGMDFRKDYSVPGRPPYQPTVGKYTDNWLLLISSSKVFSYAGQRIGMMVISDKLYNTEAEGLRRYYKYNRLGQAMIFGTVYSISSGTAHTPQYGLARVLKAVNDGELNLVEEVKEYGRRAKIMKEIFTQNGFRIVYDKDENDPIADGFYFTFSYPGFSGGELLRELLFYGVSAISLIITGSERTEGVRACVSLVKPEQLADLSKRLEQFHHDHPV